MSIIEATAHRVLHPVDDAPGFQLTLYAEPECGVTYSSRHWRPDSIDAEAQAKVLAQLERSGGAPTRRRKLALGRTMSDRAQAAEYAAVMGRPWDEVDPEPAPADFGGPVPPPYPLAPPRPYGRAARARATREHNAALDVWRTQMDAHRDAVASWRATTAYAEYVAAHTYWRTRREQFEWRGRKRDKPLAELVELTVRP